MNDDKLKSMGKMENEDPRDYLDIGSYYRQFTIVGCFGGNQSHGIARSSDEKYVFVFSTDPYHEDRYIRDGIVMLYHGAGSPTTADGKELDQNFVDGRSGNRYLLDAFIDGSPVLLFRDQDRTGGAQYKGPMIVFMRPFLETVKIGRRRKLVFPLIGMDLWSHMSVDERKKLIDEIDSQIKDEDRDVIPSFKPRGDDKYRHLYKS